MSREVIDLGYAVAIVETNRTHATLTILQPATEQMLPTSVSVRMSTQTLNSLIDALKRAYIRQAKDERGIEILTGKGE